MHAHDVFEEFSIGIVKEIAGPQNRSDIVANIGVEQNAAEHATLGFDIAWWLAIENFCGDISNAFGAVRASRPSFGWPLAHDLVPCDLI
jgi:hypothetical protein